MIFTQIFRVTGVANSITYDDGLKSSEAEKKRLVAVKVQVNKYVTTAGAAPTNNVQGYHERAKVFEIPDRMLDMEADAGTTSTPKPGFRENEIEVGLDIPVGEVFKIAIKCGATAADVHGYYIYEIA